MRLRNSVPSVLLAAAVVGCHPGAPPADTRPAADTRAQADYVPRPNEVYLKRELPPVIADDTATLSVEFPIRNDGDTTLTFGEVQKSCGCSDAELGKSSLAPGEATFLRVGLRTPGRFGPQRITCSVPESSGKTWVCDLHTTIHQRLRFDPIATHFGMVKPRSETTREVTFLCAAATEAELPSGITFTCDSPHVSLGEVRETIERPADGVVVKRLTVPAKLRGPATFGPASATLTVKGTWDGKPFSEQTSLDWNAVETFLATPRQVFFSAAEVKAGGGSKQVLLRRRDGAAMPTVAAQSPHPSVTVDVKTTADVTTLTVTFDSCKAGDFVHGEIVLTTGDADQPTVRIPVAVGK